MSKSTTPELNEFNALVAATMRERGCTRDVGASLVVKRFPKLHARVVREQNSHAEEINDRRFNGPASNYAGQDRAA